jgi:hypothetical protein
MAPLHSKVMAPLSIRWLGRNRHQAAPHSLPRQILVARWLYSQGACEPEEFLPTYVVTELSESRRKQLTKLISAPDWDWFLQIRAWMPYVEAVLADYKSLPRRQRGDPKFLERRGYNPGLIPCLSAPKQRMRSPVSVISKWFEKKGRADQKSIENSYYRINRYRPKPDPGANSSTII